MGRGGALAPSGAGLGLGALGTGTRSPHRRFLASWRPLLGKREPPPFLGRGPEAHIPGLVWRRER